MTYSWPGPVPPGARRRTIRLIRCARCQGPLRYTKAKGLPRQEDHELGCEAFSRAIRITRYVDELKRSASEPAGPWRKARRRRKYLRDSAKRLSVAACEPDPVAAVSALAELYQAECEVPRKRARAAQRTEMAETLMRACRRLGAGQDPAPITLRPA
jgi:hypothetical protein